RRGFFFPPSAPAGGGYTAEVRPPSPPEGVMAPPPPRGAYAQADVTPPLGTSMPRHLPHPQAAGVLRPPQAKVLYLPGGDESAALVAFDLIGLGAPLVARIRQRVRATAGKPPRYVWVHGTHTHTGGMVPRTNAYTSDAEAIYPEFYPGKVDEKWIDQLVEKTAAAVAGAAEQAKEEKKVTLH